MLKIKKAFLTVFIAITVIMTFGAISVYAAYPTKLDTHTGLSSNYEYTGQAAKLQTFVSYCILSSSVDDHKDSGKYAWCAPFTYSGFLNFLAAMCN